MKLSIFGVLLLFTWLLLPLQPIEAQTSSIKQSAERLIAGLDSPDGIWRYVQGNTFVSTPDPSPLSHIEYTDLNRSNPYDVFNRYTSPYYIETSDSGAKTTWVNSEPKSVQYDKVFSTDLNGIADVYFLGNGIQLIDDIEDGILMNSDTGDCFGVCAKTGSKESLPWFADRVKDFCILPTEGAFYSVVFLLE